MFSTKTLLLLTLALISNIYVKAGRCKKILQRGIEHDPDNTSPYAGNVNIHLSEAYTIPSDGYLIAWQLFVVDTSKKFYLDLWKHDPSLDSGNKMTFDLVHSTLVGNFTLGLNTKFLSEPFKVEEGIKMGVHSQGYKEGGLAQTKGGATISDKWEVCTLGKYDDDIRKAGDRVECSMEGKSRKQSMKAIIVRELSSSAQADCQQFYSQPAQPMNLTSLLLDTTYATYQLECHARCNQHPQCTATVFSNQECRMYFSANIEVGLPYEGLAGTEVFIDESVDDMGGISLDGPEE